MAGENEQGTKVALITGGVRGIGRAIALDLAADGWSIAACYRKSADDAATLGRELQARKVSSLIEACDVSDAAAAEAFAQRVTEQLGPVDALINCAGPYHRVDILDETPEGWRSMFDSNLHPVFYLSRVLAPGMKERGAGRILTFSMAKADQGTAQPKVTAHYAAKAALLILTRTLAKSLAPHGVTVNAISPGFIDSKSAPEEELAGIVKNIPAGYVGRLDDVLPMVRYLLSDDARYVTGANLVLAGGWGL